MSAKIHLLLLFSVICRSYSRPGLQPAPTPAPPPPPTPAPTPTPTLPAVSGSMSGDPIAVVNGYRVKFDLPVGKSSLMWEDSAIALFAKADVVSFDKRSSWFSEFSLLVDGLKNVEIRRGELQPMSKSVLGDLSIMSLTGATCFFP